MEIALGILLIVLAAVLVFCVLLQSGKDKKLSSSITGGSADTFFSKGKSKSKDKVLSRVTTILSVAFVVLTVVAVLFITAKY